jgi:hypothetical protein
MAAFGPPSLVPGAAAPWRRDFFGQRVDSTWTRSAEMRAVHDSAVTIQGARDMRFMVMHYSNEDNEAGVRPGPEVFEAVGEYMAEMAKSGVFLLGEGVGPSSLGARLDLDANGNATVTDGPFAEAKELIAGFAILEVSSKEEAIEHAKRFAKVIGAQRIDVRAVFE